MESKGWDFAADQATLKLYRKLLDRSDLCLSCQRFNTNACENETHAWVQQKPPAWFSIDTRTRRSRLHILTDA